MLVSSPPDPHCKLIICRNLAPSSECQNTPCGSSAPAIPSTRATPTSAPTAAHRPRRSSIVARLYGRAPPGVKLVCGAVLVYRGCGHSPRLSVIVLTYTRPPPPYNPP